MHPSASLLRDLVRLPSVNPMGRPLHGDYLYEHRVTDYLEQFFRSLGVSFERQAVAPLRENIVARFDSAGATRTLLFEAHQDTVPVDNMTIAPFGGTIEGGRLSGRGACDVKGGMAAMLTAFARLVREKPAEACNVVMACTVDEEHTFLGVQHLAKTVRADTAIVAEPTRLNVVHAHKGVVRWQVETVGRACHSSQPDLGENAIYYMGRVLPVIESFANVVKKTRNHPRLGSPTLSAGVIEGGTSVNTVPDRCRLYLDRRLLPGEDAGEAIEQLSAYLKQNLPVGLIYTVSGPQLVCPPLGEETSGELVARLGQAIDRVVGQHQVLAVPYGTDASTLSLAGIPSVVFGPGDIALAHTRDEWIALEEVEQASDILYQLAVMS